MIKFFNPMYINIMYYKSPRNGLPTYQFKLLKIANIYNLLDTAKDPKTIYISIKLSKASQKYIIYNYACVSIKYVFIMFSQL